MAAGVRRAHFTLFISFRINYGAFGSRIQSRATALKREKQCSPHLQTTPSKSDWNRPKSFIFVLNRTKDGRTAHVRMAERIIGCNAKRRRDNERRLIPYIRTKMIYFQHGIKWHIFIVSAFYRRHRCGPRTKIFCLFSASKFESLCVLYVQYRAGRPVAIIHSKKHASLEIMNFYLN